MELVVGTSSGSPSWGAYHLWSPLNPLDPDDERLTMARTMRLLEIVLSIQKTTSPERHSNSHPYLRA